MIDREAMQLLFYGILIALLRQEKPEIKLERGIESEKRDVQTFKFNKYMLPKSKFMPYATIPENLLFIYHDNSYCICCNY